MIVPSVRSTSASPTAPRNPNTHTGFSPVMATTRRPSLPLPATLPHNRLCHAKGLAKLGLRAHHGSVPRSDVTQPLLAVQEEGNGWECLRQPHTVPRSDV